MSVIRGCNMFITPDYVLPFFKAQKEIAKSVYKEREIYEDPNKCFLLLEDIRNIFNLRFLGTNIEEISESDAFLKYHSRFSRELEDTLDFISLKLNVDEKLSIREKLIKDIHQMQSFWLEDDFETIPARVRFLHNSLTNIFDLTTFNLKVKESDAEIVVKEIGLILENFLSKLKNIKYSDKEYVQDLEFQLVTMLGTCVQLEILSSLVLLIFDNRIQNMQKGITEIDFSVNELEVIKLLIIMNASNDL